MIITGMEHFQSVCKKKLVEWYNENNATKIDIKDTFVVWSCKALQNYKCIVSTKAHGYGISAEYTYNGDLRELHEDVYEKISNRCIREE